MYNATLDDCVACSRLFKQGSVVKEQAEALMGECLLVHATRSKNRGRKLSICQEVLGDISGNRINETWVLPQLREQAAKIVG